MPLTYQQVVLRSLRKHKAYPVLKHYVVIDIFYKLLPHTLGTSAGSYDRLQVHPGHVYKRDAHPFRLSYLAPSADPHLFHLCHLDPSQPLNLDTLPLQCISVKLTRSYLDRTVLHRPSASFEEEIYHFITLLNFDVSRLAGVLDQDLLLSTRILPQRIELTPSLYDLRPVGRPLADAAVLRQRFGPPFDAGAFPLRSLLGRLSECTSSGHILSLHDPLGEESRLSFLHHYVESMNAIVPLAYNPLENPIIHPQRR